ncbi:MAG: nucleotide-binding universal stress UspA family protein [Sulfitobacter sp.]|jgi:nucleotide-binding universal stress UspA family protein
MKTIAVATDLSMRSDRAVARAWRLADEHNATLYVFSVVDDTLPEALGETVAAETQARLVQFCEAQTGADKVTWHAQILRGAPDEALATAAKSYGADLMVLGLHRRRPFMDLIFETTMERLTRSLGCPVLIVRDPADHAYTCVLGALDFAPASADALRIARRLAPTAGLHAAHAVPVPYVGMATAPGLTGELPPMIDPAPFMEAAVQQKYAWLDANPDLADLADISVEEGSVQAVIGHKRAALRPDLISMGAHGRALPVPWLMGSFATDMMRDPPCDLLIVPPKG